MEKNRMQSLAFILAILLFGIAISALSANRKVRIKTQHQRSQINMTMLDSVKKARVDTLSLYSGHVVSSKTNIYASSTLQIDSTKVAHDGDLRATSETSIVIPSDMEVELGGELQLNGSGQYYISYTYNGMGFRTLRKHESNP